MVALSVLALIHCAASMLASISGTLPKFSRPATICMHIPVVNWQNRAKRPAICAADRDQLATANVRRDTLVASESLATIRIAAARHAMSNQITAHIRAEG